MSKYKIIEIMEQDAIYDEEPNLMPASLLMTVINHNCHGGSQQDLKDAINDGDLKDPKIYTVRLIVEIKEREGR